MNKWNNKFRYQVASCWLFILSYTTMHGSMNIKFIHHYAHVTVQKFLHRQTTFQHVSVAEIIRIFYLLYVYSAGSVFR